MTESLSGEGKVYKGQQFIAKVHYELEIHSHRKTTRTHTSEGPYSVDQDVLLRINPASAVGGQFDAGELLTLHMSDGRKQEFLVTSSEGACQPSGGPQSLNHYSYTRSDAVNNTDPSGMLCGSDEPGTWACTDGGGGGGGGGYFGPGFCSTSVSYCGGFGSGCSPILGCGSNGNGDYFGGGPQCMIDNMGAPCGLANGLLQAGAAAACPNNICEGVRLSDNRPVYFRATTNGPGAYYTYSGPGALYYSVQAAGIALFSYIFDTHGNAPREYGNDIYQDQNGVYSFNEPIAGPDCTINTLCSINPRNFTEPDGTEIAGIAHTHPFGGEFTFPNDYDAPDTLQVPAFLGNPRGCIQVYVPVAGQKYQGSLSTLRGSPAVCP